MKKTTTLVFALVLIFGLVSSQANAQKISAGVKADMNLSNFILSDMDDIESNIGVGASFGGFANFKLSKYFSVQPELLFHYKASEIKINTSLEDITSDYEYFGMEIPVYALGEYRPTSNGKLYGGIGPYLGIGFSAKNKFDGDDDIDLYEKDDITDEAAMQRIDFGFGAIIGYEFDFGLQINAGYKIGVLNSLDAGKDDSTMLPSTISIGLGYRF